MSNVIEEGNENTYYEVLEFFDLFSRKCHNTEFLVVAEGISILE